MNNHRKRVYMSILEVRNVKSYAYICMGLFKVLISYAILMILLACPWKKEETAEKWYE